MRHTPSKKEREHQAWMLGQGAISLLFALDNFDQFCEYVAKEAKFYNKIEDDYIVNKQRLKESIEEAFRFLNKGAGLV